MRYVQAIICVDFFFQVVQYCQTMGARPISGEKSLVSARSTLKKAQVVIKGSEEDLKRAFRRKVYFSFDSAHLGAQALALLEKQAAWLEDHLDVTVTIEGHCDERGTVEYNLALGRRRALAVKNYLNELGVDSDRMSIISHGKGKPEVVGSHPSAWEKNRRAVTKLHTR